MKTTLLTLIILFFSMQSVMALTGAACNCWQSRDSSWSVVAFDGSGGSGGPGLPPEYRNDDWSSDTIHLPFNFCFYGDTITEVFINNNGNVSIGSAYATFTANSFPDPTYAMVAPLWSDVDTRDSVLSGIVYYKLTQHHLIVQWDHVGYFNTHADKTNTYQLIISDGASGLLPEQKNVGFCYQDMQWTTGDASGGTNGFGGTPATAGVNYGDGINYLQIGLYDNSTLSYDGPYGSNDGIGSLAYQSFAFNVCVTNFNVPPILSGDFICDTITLCLGDTFSYSADFLSPEQLQTTNVTYNDHGMGGVNFTSTPGNPSSVSLSFVAAVTGLHEIDIIGQDNGSPPASTAYTLLVNILNCNVGVEDFDLPSLQLFPNPVNDVLTLKGKGEHSYVRIYDQTGVVVFEGKLHSDASISTIQWNPGIYFISWITKDKVITQRILKTN